MRISITDLEGFGERVAGNFEQSRYHAAIVNDSGGSFTRQRQPPATIHRDEPRAAPNSCLEPRVALEMWHNYGTRPDFVVVVATEVYLTCGITGRVVRNAPPLQGGG